MKNSNLKALNPVILETAVNKVTLGFKCSPQFKLQLIREAEQRGVTLSEYVESLLLEAWCDDFSALRAENEGLKTRLSFYENGLLRRLFEHYRGRNLPFRSPNGERGEFPIRSIEDVFTLILKVAKPKFIDHD